LFFILPDDDKMGTDIKKAASIIKNGGVVIYPTETVYGIGASIFSEDALKRVFTIKKRLPDKPVSIAVSSFSMMEKLVFIKEQDRAFIKKFLPGPVTVILKKKSEVPDILTAGGNVVGIRFPDYEITIKLIKDAGVPITSTSANLSGGKPPKRVEEIKIDADYILEGGICGGEPSTVVDLVNRNVIRKGAKYEEVLAALKNQIEIH
jgi:L-threonylcarbamoyladenylate synthase